MAASLKREGSRGSAGQEWAAGLAEAIHALAQGPLPDSRGMARLALRRALSRLLDVYEDLAAGEPSSATEATLHRALVWLEFAERAGGADAESGRLRARLLVLSRRIRRARDGCGR